MQFGKRSEGKSSIRREAFEKQAERVYPSVFSTAFRLTHSKEEAEDLAQEAIVRAFEAYERFDGDNFKAWILRITMNAYINKYRQKQRSPQISALENETGFEPAELEEFQPERLLFDDMMGPEVESAMEKLPYEFRTAVVLSDIEGLSYQEVADATNCPVGTVRSRLARGRALLREQLLDFALASGIVKNGNLE